MTNEPEWVERFVEEGANIEHDRWSRWQKYMFSKGVVGPDGEFHLPEEFVDRWFRQIDTKYADLSEPEKESDRKETRNYLPLIQDIIKEEKEKTKAELLSKIEEEVDNIDVVDNPNGELVLDELRLKLSKYKTL